MAKKLVEIAEKEARFTSPTAAPERETTRLRFESTIHALNPAIKIIAPWRNLGSQIQGGSAGLCGKAQYSGGSVPKENIQQGSEHLAHQP
jgi:hypothetical protein